MKLKVWYNIIDAGKQGPQVAFFTNEEDARNSVEFELEMGFPTYPNSVGYHIFNTEDFDEI